MANAPKTYININGQNFDAASITHPADRRFRDAWQYDGDVITVDMGKARNIVRTQLRTERAENWRLVDGMFRDAFDSDDAASKTAWRDKRRKYRDAPQHPSINAAQDEAALAMIDFDTVTA